ncbi:DUF1521 domain-containing protein [Sphingomonas sanxanigenens]|uniref:DUF1521 domain-containing protein n=1 Tax=Sphingomonas sanxanigenens DSM 19645 = NX02 TaxID=1123269 RepID=W0AEV6_9SPHN|nr:DUF1521 domain-containing protein [Sphingomonas sanxanigenens]AHE54833.1 hypothetical protein NX02_15765 [Sphingomonas sanxanigenens DSM 19645 = NX02]
MSDIIYNTSLTANAYLQPGSSPNNAIEGQAIQLAAGILGTFIKPLFAGPFAFAQLPSQFALLGGTMQPPLRPGASPIFAPQPGAQWSASLTSEHTGNIDLGDGYTMRLDERSSEIMIHNEKTNEWTRIWGDPHVDVNGERAFDFWGTTTFTLENGTKVTIDTEQWGGNPDAYVASKVTVTNGDRAIVVDGISQNEIGDLEISMSDNGALIDAATRDGFVLHENATGLGWRSELTGEVARHADLEITKPGELYGPGSTAPSFGEIREALGTFLMFGIAVGIGESFAAAARTAIREDLFA